MSAAEQTPETEHGPRPDRRIVHATCTTHGAGIGFTNLVATKRDGNI